jgi:choline kinase
MKAVILCAGLGGRLRPLTEAVPKCLLDVGGESILDRCLRNLEGAGISGVVIVTGYRNELVEQAALRSMPGRVSFVHNADYARTNTAFSLNLALKAMDSDFILVNGDVVFDKAILDDLVRHPCRSCLAVDQDAALDHEEVKVIVRDGRVDKVGKDADPGRSQGEAIGLNKIGADLIADLIGVFDGLEAKGELHHYFEKGFDVLCGRDGSGGPGFGVCPTRRRPWVEIDTFEDYDYALKEIIPGLRPD